MVQSKVSSTTNPALSVDPDTVCVNGPGTTVPPSLTVMVIWYWSMGLSPGTAAVQLACSVSPGICGAVHSAETFAGADGTMVLVGVETVTGLLGGLVPPASVFTTVTW